MNYLFVTGMFRSGTTLVERVADNFQGNYVANQPFPLLFVYLKNVFLRSINLQRTLPLGDLFLEVAYKPEDFDEFIEQYRLSENDLLAIASQLKNYSGTGSDHTPDIIKKAPRQTLANLWKHILQELSQIDRDEEHSLLGAKEIVCEEYIPYLLKNGIKVLLVVRDPRDIVRSLYFGKGPQIMGKTRPVLAVARLWRKSIAYGMKYVKHPGFHVVRYEDLLDSTESTLAKIAQFCGKTNPTIPTLEHLKDQTGKPWRANTSFDRKTNLLSTQQVHQLAYIQSFITACCHPEMLAYGYDVNEEVELKSAMETILEYEEPFIVDHPHFDMGMSEKPEEKSREIERLKFLYSKERVPDIRQWFIFAEVLGTLRNSVNT